MNEDVKRIIDQAIQTEDQSLPFIPSFPLNRFLWIQSEALDGFISTIISEISTLSDTARRKRDQKTHKKFVYALKIIILNLLKIDRIPRRTLLAIPKGAGSYSAKARYDNILAAFRPFMDAYDGLLRLGYIQEARKGYFDRDKSRGEVTRIQATEKLKSKLHLLFPQKFIFFSTHPDAETIFLKNEDKKLIDYQDTPFTLEARTNLRKINECLLRHWYDLDLTNEAFAELSQNQLEKHVVDNQKHSVVDYSARSLYRIFNNGTFDQGGRFYGGWWEAIPSEYRKYVTIDSKWTVEIDYSSLHPSILYAIEGLDLPEDAYQIEGVKDRSMVKQAFARLLNGKKTFLTPEGYDEEKIGLPWKDLLHALEEKHQPITKYFRTGYGNQLMFMDAQCAERIMLHFAAMDVPCLPVHDSFIIHHAYADELRDVMIDAYRTAFTNTPKTKTSNNFDWLTQAHIENGFSVPTIGDVLHDIETSEHEQRWQLWLEQKK